MASVSDTARRTAFVRVNGSCVVRTFSTYTTDPLIVDGIQTSGSIDARSPRFRTSPTTPTISNQACCTGSGGASRLMSRTRCPSEGVLGRYLRTNVSFTTATFLASLTSASVKGRPSLNANRIV
jgi:hypothetical protein